MGVRSLQEKDRKQMLRELGKHGALQGNAKDRGKAIGYHGGKRALSPNANRPPMAQSPDTFSKWAQAALSTVLGAQVKIDGEIGPVTRVAIKRFQRLEGLTAHGYLDERTVQVMELRTGVKAPRGFSHEPLPHLLRLPRKGVWRPKQKPPGEKNKNQGQSIAVESPHKLDDGEQDVHEKEAPQSEDKTSENPVRTGFLQDEAMAAVAAQAFDNDFAHFAANRLKRQGWQTVQAEMHSWWREALSDDPARQPRWVHQVSAEARGMDEQASGRLRRRWWSAHVDGSER